MTACRTSEKNSAEEMCSSCFNATKYVCIGCQMPICTDCCDSFGDKEKTSGWLEEKAIGFCEPCTKDNYFTAVTKERAIRKSAAEGEIAKNQEQVNGSDSNGENDLDVEERSDQGSLTPTKMKKKPGRRSNFSQDDLIDLIDIILENEEYKRKLIFQNTKFKHNSEVYSRILRELKDRATKGGRKIDFNVSQIRIKFKKCVSECKKAAMTVKTATGIKRFQEDKNYGSWFPKLFEIVKTRDSCQPEQAREPQYDNPDDESEEPNDNPEGVQEFVPKKESSRKRRKKDSGDISNAIQLMQKVVDNDPTKDLIAFMREEFKEARQHEMNVMKLLTAPAPPAAPAFPQPSYIRSS